MKVMVIVKATRTSEAGVLPTEAEFKAMGDFNRQLVEAGIMVTGDGLLPSSRGKRIHFSEGRVTVVDGPFPDPESLVAGFWIWKVKSMDEAVEWARRCPDPMPGEDSVLELRAMPEPEDFGESFTPELRAEEERLRTELEKGR